MNPWTPRVLKGGEGGLITTETGLRIGQMGDWTIETFGDDIPYLKVTGCIIARMYRSAGVQRVVCRPTSPAGATITGTVKLLDATRINIGDLTIAGIPELAGVNDEQE